MPKTRRLIAIVCIAVMVFTAMTPMASHLLCGVLVPLGPLFGTVVSLPTPQADDARCETGPCRSVRTSRAPPA
jgi:hypothetical protein